MARAYTLKRRAERQADTRARIVEAAVELHTTVGPGRTTWTMLAERAGVQRHTLYAHFPDERSLLAACSGLAFERDPPPNAAPYAALDDPDARLRTGLAALYGWYERNAELNASVLRDAEVYPLVREISEGQMRPLMAGWIEALGADRSPAQQALLGLALSFHTFRTLAGHSGEHPGGQPEGQAGGLGPAGAAELMAAAIARA
jgi:AcrR family transcriptional regulator